MEEVQVLPKLKPDGERRRLELRISNVLAHYGRVSKRNVEGAKSQTILLTGTPEGCCTASLSLHNQWLTASVGGIAPEI